MELGRTRLDTRRFGSTENRLDAMAYSISGLTHTISTNPIASSFKEVSTRCFDSTGIRLNAMYFWQMCRQLTSILLAKATGCRRNRHSEEADGLSEAGLFRSLLLRNQSSSSLRTVSFSAIRNR
jgi:hypothetical protein